MAKKKSMIKGYIYCGREVSPKVYGHHRADTMHRMQLAAIDAGLNKAKALSHIKGHVGDVSKFTLDELMAIADQYEKYWKLQQDLPKYDVGILCGWYNSAIKRCDGRVRKAEEIIEKHMKAAIKKVKSLDKRHNSDVDWVKRLIGAICKKTPGFLPRRYPADIPNPTFYSYSSSLIKSADKFFDNLGQSRDRKKKA